MPGFLCALFVLDVSRCCGMVASSYKVHMSFWLLLLFLMSPGFLPSPPPPPSSLLHPVSPRHGPHADSSRRRRRRHQPPSSAPFLLAMDLTPQSTGRCPMEQMQEAEPHSPRVSKSSRRSFRWWPPPPLLRLMSPKPQRSPSADEGPRRAPAAGARPPPTHHVLNLSFLFSSSKARVVISLFILVQFCYGRRSSTENWAQNSGCKKRSADLGSMMHCLLKRRALNKHC